MTTVAISPEVSLAGEYEKNPELKKEDIVQLQSWITSQPHLPSVPEGMLVLFHHSCYYKIEDTKDCIDTYYSLRSSTPELFTNRDVTKAELAKALSTLDFAILPKPDPSGFQIVYHGINDYDSSKYMFVDGTKLLLMTMDSCLRQCGTAPGLIILFNMQGASLMHLTRLSLTIIRKFFVYIQEANPVRLKAIHVINTVPFIDKIMSLIKPFIKKELMSLLHFHNSDMEAFSRQHIPKECLPSDFGGELESVQVLSGRHNKRLESLAGYFAEEQKLRVDEKKRSKNSKKKGGKTASEPEGSFANLEID